MKIIITHLLMSAFLWLTLIPTSLAQLNVSAIFRSDMVVQRGTEVPVFGTAAPGASVSVSFLGQNVSAVADASGNWQATLSSMSANSSMNDMTVSSGSETVTFTGVQVGEVWLCSGQSNMAWELSQSDEGSEAIAESGNYNIRLFRMDAGNGPETSSWEVANPTNSSDFSAVGWWMGKELSQWFGNVPIGLIQATHDGTAIDQWTHTNGGTAADYEAMVKPIQPYAIKGVAWYQGESDGGNSNYDVLLTDMIGEWRSDWGLSNLPFGIVQLTGTERSKGARLSQYIVSQTVPNTYLVVTADLPGGNQLHPTTKKPVGLRAAIGARGAVYGENIPYSGPVPDGANSYASGSTVVLNWHFVGNGLITSDGSAPSTFQVAGSNGRFSSATATIVGSTIELTSSVSDPTTVRYQFGSVGNFFNSVSIPIEGGTSTLDMLPASMFEVELETAGTNDPPTASFSYSVSDLTINLDGSASSDNDGSISSWGWDFGDGNTGSGEQVNHTYSSSGDYMVTLTVTDDGGATNSTSQTVSVAESSGGGTVMHVQNIATYTQSAGQGNKNGVADITIHDDQENPVSGATVTGTFSGSFNETVTAQTGSDGVATLVTSATLKGGVTVNICVDNVSHASLAYEPAQNDITCTGSSARTSFLSGAEPENNQLLTYPNPAANGRFTIIIPKEIDPAGSAIRIFTLGGELVHEDIMEQRAQTIQKELPKGVYIVRLQGKGKEFTSKLIIK